MLIFFFYVQSCSCISFNNKAFFCVMLIIPITHNSTKKNTTKILCFRMWNSDAIYFQALQN